LPDSHAEFGFFIQVKVLGWQARTNNKWKVNLDILPENEEQRLFIARYLTKCPIALERIEIIDNPLAPAVRYSLDTEERKEYVEISPLEFLARISVHIPKPLRLG